MIATIATALMTPWRLRPRFDQKGTMKATLQVDQTTNELRTVPSPRKTGLGRGPGWVRGAA